MYIDITCLVPEDRKALLVARDPISDIAIFAATDSVGIDDPSGSLTLSQLHAHEINSGVWPVQAWTVAYCGDEDPPRFTQLQAEYMQALNHSQGLSTGDLTSQMVCELYRSNKEVINV